MIRLLHLAAIAGLIASAIYAYSIKYDTLYQAEQVAKLKTRLRKERDAIAVLRAEWQLLTRPDRLQGAVDKYLDLEPIGTAHLARLADLPAKVDRGDEIARKLEALGLGATATPAAKERAPSTTAARSEEPRTTGSTSTSTPTRTVTPTAKR